MTTDVTARLAAFAAQVHWDDLPESARVAARRTAVNVIALSVGAAESAAADALVGAAGDLGQHGPARILGRPERLAPAWAAWVNGLTAHLEDFDDTYLSCILHPGAPIVPAALAVAELSGADGAELMSGVVAGVEVASRLGDVMSPSIFDRCWHVTSTVGAIGAACAAGRVLKFDVDRMRAAMAIAATQAAAHSGHLGTMGKAFQVGRAASLGVEAALFAEQGLTGAAEPLQGSRGMAVVTADDADWSQIDDLGDRWRVELNALKPYSCGIVSHPVIDAGRELRGSGVAPASVARVVLEVHPRVVEVMGIAEPRNGLESKFSFQHCFAVGMIRGAGGPPEFSDEAATDPDIAALRRRVDAQVDPNRAEDSCHMTVTLTNGESIGITVEHATASVARPMSAEFLKDKVIRLVDNIDDPLRLWSVGSRLDQVSDVSELFNAAGA